jgi:hypothetical protein
LALVTSILRCRSFFVRSCSVPVIVVRRATWYGGRAACSVTWSAADDRAALESSAELASTTPSEPSERGRAVARVVTIKRVRTGAAARHRKLMPN